LSETIGPGATVGIRTGVVFSSSVEQVATRDQLTVSEKYMQENREERERDSHSQNV
jgi:hypothetical protein